MIIEQVMLGVSDANGETFRSAVQEARKFIEIVAPFEFRRSVEEPTKYLFLVRWKTLQDHKDYQGMPEFQKFVGAFRPHIEKSHGMVHYAANTGAVDKPLPDRLLETVTLTVHDQDGLEKALPEIMKHRLGAKGQDAVEMRHCIEKPELFELFTYWTSLEAHTVDYRGSPQYPLFTEALRPFFTPPVSVEHWQTV